MLFRSEGKESSSLSSLSRRWAWYLPNVTKNCSIHSVQILTEVCKSRQTLKLKGRIGLTYDWVESLSRSNIGCGRLCPSTLVESWVELESHRVGHWNDGGDNQLTKFLRDEGTGCSSPAIYGRHWRPQCTCLPPHRAMQTDERDTNGCVLSGM